MEESNDFDWICTKCGLRFEIRNHETTTIIYP